jgi:hypothetical protein
MHGSRQIVYRMRTRTSCNSSRACNRKSHAWAEADCAVNEDQNIVFKILELATERVMHGWKQIVYRMRIRTLCSRFLSLQQKESCMSGGRLCTE